MTQDTDGYLRINELKNYLYCPRISFYALCMGLDRETGLSQLGVEAEADVKTRMKRRQHALHAVVNGRRWLDVEVVSHAQQIIGKIDEVVETAQGVYLVDYKDTDRDYGYWKMQLCAYRMCFEEAEQLPVLGCYIYTLPTQTYHEIKLRKPDQAKFIEILDEIRSMVRDERCPSPVQQAGKCAVCQYARFCNDVF
jgi:CRISPR-associated exonuclease Cas4